MTASSTYAGDSPIQQKLETAAAVRHADEPYAFELQEGAVKRKWQGTDADRKEMSQLGRVQELRVSCQGGYLEHRVATSMGIDF
jgi:hypothetical protein